MDPAADDLLKPGDRIGRFEIRALIGRGGMGAVYRARDTTLLRQVALKTPGKSASADMLARFGREAQAATYLGHRHVVVVHDVIHHEGVPYLVMEYLDGEDLGALLSREAPLEIARAVDILLAVCSAVQACHGEGIVHRDLKPGNVFLAETLNGIVPKVMDFGVAKWDQASDLTEDGQRIGTPSYWSPEQELGQKATPASDQYSIGALLYGATTGSLPYQGLKDLGRLEAMRAEAIVPPRQHRPDLPEELEAVILRALRTAPDDRWPSVHALGRALLPFASAAHRTTWNHYYLTPPSPRRSSAAGQPPLEAPPAIHRQLDALQPQPPSPEPAEAPGPAPDAPPAPTVRLPDSEGVLVSTKAAAVTSHPVAAEPAASSRRAPWTMVIAVVLAGGVAVAGATIYRQRSLARSGPASVSSPVAPAVPTAPVAASPPPPPAGPAASPAPVVRAHAATSPPGADLLARAERLLAAGQFERAARAARDARASGAGDAATLVLTRALSAMGDRRQKRPDARVELDAHGVPILE